MEDYIKIKTKLQLGRNSSVKFVQENDIDNIKDVNIDTKLSKADRMIEFLRNVKNPYMFIIDGMKVKFEYSEGGSSINQCLENLIMNRIKV